MTGAKYNIHPSVISKNGYLNVRCLKPFNGSEGAHETNIASVIDDEDVDDVIRALQDYQKSKQKKMNQIGKQIKKERELNIQNPKIVYFDFARHIKEKQKAE